MRNGEVGTGRLGRGGKVIDFIAAPKPVATDEVEHDDGSRTAKLVWSFDAPTEFAPFAMVEQTRPSRLEANARVLTRWESPVDWRRVREISTCYEAVVMGERVRVWLLRYEPRAATESEARQSAIAAELAKTRDSRVMAAAWRAGLASNVSPAELATMPYHLVGRMHSPHIVRAREAARRLVVLQCERQGWECGWLTGTELTAIATQVVRAHAARRAERRAAWLDRR